MKDHFAWIAALLAASALLAALLAPNFLRARSRGHFTPCKSNLKNLAIALGMYATDQRGLFPRRLAQLTPDILRGVPTCPAAGRDTYSEGYVATAGREPAFTVVCTGENHAAVGLPANYPQYDSTNGLRER